METIDPTAEHGCPGEDGNGNRKRDLNHELDRSNLDLAHELMMEKIGITYQKLLEMTAKKGDVLFSSIVGEEGISDIMMNLRKLINPKVKRCVPLNGSKTQKVMIFVQNQTAPYFGVRRDTRELVVRTTNSGWTLTGVFFKK